MINFYRGGYSFYGSAWPFLCYLLSFKIRYFFSLTSLLTSGERATDFSNLSLSLGLDNRAKIANHTNGHAENYPHYTHFSLPVFSLQLQHCGVGGGRRKRVTEQQQQSKNVSQGECGQFSLLAQHADFCWVGVTLTQLGGQ